MQSTISQAIRLMEMYLKAKIVPMLHGSPGIGKSQIVHALAKKYNLKLLDLRLAQCDPVDLMGFPTIIDNRGNYVPMENFPIEGDALPEGYDGWLLFLDECNSATQAMQAAGYKLILDRMVGNHKLHSRVGVVAAGNLETDGAIVNEMSSALQSRMAHIVVVPDAKEFIDWAAGNGFDPRITAYLSLCTNDVHNFSPDHTDYTYPCPRTWEFANRMMKLVPESHPDFLPALAGVLSEGTARQLQGYCTLYKDQPQIKDVIRNPEGIPMPEEPGILWALTGSISTAVTPGNCEALMKFVARMEMEYQAMTVRQMRKRVPTIEEHPSVVKWIGDFAAALY